MRSSFPEAEQFRVRVKPWATQTGDHFGAFYVPGPCGRNLQIIVSEGTAEIAWEHVSVSLPTRNPNWDEMCFVKRLFWEDEECVMQLHPPASVYVNDHPFCLHLWRPRRQLIPLPPPETITARKP